MATGLPTPNQPIGKTIGDKLTGDKTKTTKKETPLEKMARIGWTKIWKTKAFEKFLLGGLDNTKSLKEMAKYAKISNQFSLKQIKLQMQAMKEAARAAERARQQGVFGGVKGKIKEGMVDKVKSVGMWKLLLIGLIAIIVGIYLVFKGLTEKLSKWTGTLKLIGKNLIEGGLKFMKSVVGFFMKFGGFFTKAFAKFFDTIGRKLFIFFARTLPGMLSKMGGNLLKGGPVKKLLGTVLKMAAKFLKFIAPLLRKIPVIGLLISIGFAVKRFMGGDIIGGLLDLASGIASLVPVAGTALSIAIDLFSAYRDSTKNEKGEASGATNMIGTMIIRFAKYLGKVLKMIPVIGLIFGIGLGVMRFMNGDIVAGIVEILSGIASVLPGPGTAISIGLDLLLATYDATGGQEKHGGFGGMLASFGEWLYPKLKYIPIIGSLILLGEGIYSLIKGDIPIGLIKIVGAIISIVPVLGTYLVPAIAWLTDKVEAKDAENVAAGKGKMNLTQMIIMMKDLIVEKVKQLFGFIMKLGEALSFIFTGNPKVGFYMLFSSLASLPLIGGAFGYIANWIGEPTEDEKTKAVAKKASVIKMLKAKFFEIVKRAFKFFLNIGDALLFMASGSPKIGFWKLFSTLGALPVIGKAFTWIASLIGAPTETEMKTAQIKKVSLIDKFKAWIMNAPAFKFITNLLSVAQKDGVMVAIGQLLTSVLPAGAADFVSALFGSSASAGAPARSGRLTSIIDQIISSISSVFTNVIDGILSIWKGLKRKIYNLVDAILPGGMKQKPGESAEDFAQRQNQKKFDDRMEANQKTYEQLRKDAGADQVALKTADDWLSHNTLLARQEFPVQDFIAGPGDDEKTMSIGNRRFSFDKRDSIIAAPFGSLLQGEKYTGLSKASTDLAGAINSPIVSKLEEIKTLLMSGKSSIGKSSNSSPSIISINTPQRGTQANIAIEGSTSVD